MSECRKPVVAGTTGQRFPLAPGSNRRFWLSFDEVRWATASKRVLFEGAEQVGRSAALCALFGPQPTSEVLHDPGVYP